MRDELQAQINAGGSDTMVMNWFVAKYGAIVLAAPIRGGFDNVAWIVPAAVFLLALVGTAILILVWKRRTVRLAPVGSVDVHADAMRERIRRETEY
jgi:cytochrome c-type biogenesis protein CcmH